MESIASFIEIPKVTARSYRNELLKQLYEIYTSQPELTKKENRRRYHAWVRVAHPKAVLKNGFNKETYQSYKEEFKSAKLDRDNRFIKYIPESRFWFFFSHCDVDGLEKIISEAKDMKYRGYNVAGFIMGQVIHRK